jgi:hypothetical protein
MDRILSLLRPVTYFFPTWVYSVSSSFVRFTNWNWIQAIFEVFHDSKIPMSDDTLPEEESAVVIANHVS